MSTKKWPWPMNQPGQPYPAEILRAQHYAATSGGNGVSSPESFKVVAQSAPDGTVQVLPGGADVVSTYAGQSEQTYHARDFRPNTVEIAPTGSSSGGRHDLVVLRVCDPQFDDHPEAQRNEQGEITAEEAAKHDFWWIEVIQGRSATTPLPYPHVKLAHIRRPANTTIVTNDHIIDLRELSNPKNHLHMRSANLYMSEEQSLHTGGDGTTPFEWPRSATHYARIPEWAEKVQIAASWGTVRASSTSTGTARGVVHVYLISPDGREIRTQQSSWRYAGGERSDRFNIVLGDDINIPASFRGQECRVELRGVKRTGPNIYMDGDSSWTLQLYFEQEIA